MQFSGRWIQHNQTYQNPSQHLCRTLRWRQSRRLKNALAVRFGTEYRPRIIAETDQCQRGELGALFRREHPYSGRLRDWSKQLAHGGEQALSKSAPGPRPKMARELRKLEKPRRADDRRALDRFDGRDGVVPSYSRPRVCNDNAFSEAQFKTRKCQPDHPGRFDHDAHARAWCKTCVDWYHFDHHHAGLAGYTPEQVFTGRYLKVSEARQGALAARPAQNVAGPPGVGLPPQRAVINPVTSEQFVAGVSEPVNFPTLPTVAAARSKSSVTSRCLYKSG
ncbi:MAG: hypothetical protein DWQ08_07490 [Proteobacteria bacterium]|nr:MAG: hypothetical protein DWQ08_07490 [Pseudomonadota bacterium]